MLGFRRLRAGGLVGPIGFSGTPVVSVGEMELYGLKKGREKASLFHSFPMVFLSVFV